METGGRDETQIANALAAGDRAAFEQLFRCHNAAMIRLATAILHNRASAEEITQDCWVSILRNIDRFEGRSSLAGWIFTILTNAARSRARRDGRSISFDDDDDEGGLAAAFDGHGRWKAMPDLWENVTPERILAGRNILDQVNVAVDNLPPAQRAVMILRGQQELDADEVCAMLEISHANMRVLLHRARLSVRAELDHLLG